MTSSAPLRSQAPATLPATQALTTSTNPKKAGKPFPFLELHPEVRNLIYEMIGEQSYKDTVIISSTIHRTDMPPPLTRVNKQIRSEATKLICHGVEVEFDTSWNEDIGDKWLCAISDITLLGVKRFVFPSLPDEDDCNICVEMSIFIDFCRNQPITADYGGCTCEAASNVREKVREIRQAWSVCGEGAKERRRFMRFALLTAYDIE